MYEVKLSAKARDVFDRADTALAKKLARCFAQLESEPRRHHNIRALRGSWEGAWRYRLGDWRVLYVIDDVAKTVKVTEITTRQGAY